jgi:hypothetical protein
MNALFRRLGPLADKALSVVIWLHDSIMLFICIFWLLPLIALVVISVFLYDLRPLLRERIDTIFLYGLIALPPWLVLCLYAELAITPAADRMKAWMRRLPVYIGYVVLGVGGVLWLLGVI